MESYILAQAVILDLPLAILRLITLLPPGVALLQFQQLLATAQKELM